MWKWGHDRITYKNREQKKRYMAVLIDYNWNKIKVNNEYASFKVTLADHQAKFDFIAQRLEIAVTCLFSLIKSVTHFGLLWPKQLTVEILSN